MNSPTVSLAGGGGRAGGRRRLGVPKTVVAGGVAGGPEARGLFRHSSPSPHLDMSCRSSTCDYRACTTPSIRPSLVGAFRHAQPRTYPQPARVHGVRRLMEKAEEFRSRQEEADVRLLDWAASLEPDGGLPGPDPDTRVLRTALLLCCLLTRGHTCGRGVFRQHVQRVVVFSKNWLGARRTLRIGCSSISSCRGRRMTSPLREGLRGVCASTGRGSSADRVLEDARMRIGACCRVGRMTPPCSSAHRLRFHRMPRWQPAG
jgi:hypothetical protein